MSEKHTAIRECANISELNNIIESGLTRDEADLCLHRLIEITASDVQYVDPNDLHSSDLHPLDLQQGGQFVESADLQQPQHVSTKLCSFSFTCV